MTKASGVLSLCAHYGLEASRAAAFGDDRNDLELFLAVGYPVAMGNAVPELKERAREITETNDRDGVAVVVERMLTEAEQAGVTGLEAAPGNPAGKGKDRLEPA
ncbi:HAD family hydrolase [Paenibacillus sp. CC-CFT747]|nr:HAD family hydrolase [Paenibacillus sp. CC-CFT747]